MAIRADDVDLDRDAALVERFQTGDEDAFADLYQRYFARLRRYCQRRLGDSHDAEEAAQEALVRAYRALPNFSGDKRFYPWLRVIAANLCADICKRKPPAAPFDPDRGDVVVESVFEVLDRQQVQAALENLNPRHQAALSLWAEGYQSREIAEELGCSRGAVDVTLHRARQSFRRHFLAIAGDGKLGVVGILPALTRFAEKLRARVGTRVAEYSELASPLAAKVAAGAIAISVVGGAAAIDTGTHTPPAPAAPPPAVVATVPAVASAPEPVAPAASLAAATRAGTPTPAPAPPATPTAAPAPPERTGVQVMTADQADSESKDMPIQLNVADTSVRMDPAAALGNGQLPPLNSETRR
jgi:RNA polymerase sigma-70 factor, ECF subfamily